MFNQPKSAQDETPDALKARVSEALDSQLGMLEDKYPHPKDRHLQHREVDFLFAAAGVVLDPFTQDKQTALKVAEAKMSVDRQQDLKCEGL